MCCTEAAAKSLGNIVYAAPVEASGPCIHSPHSLKATVRPLKVILRLLKLLQLMFNLSNKYTTFPVTFFCLLDKGYPYCMQLSLEYELVSSQSKLEFSFEVYLSSI